MPELVPHPLVTRVGLSLAGNQQAAFPPEAAKAAGSLSSEWSTAAAAARLAALRSAADVAQAASAAATKAYEQAERRAHRARTKADKLRAAADEAAELTHAREPDADAQQRADEADREALDAEDAALEAEDEAQAMGEAAAKAEAIAKEAAEPLPAPTDDHASPTGGATAFDPIDVDDLHNEQKDRLAAALADNADLPDLSLFAGFLGGQVERGDGNLWRLVYLDSRLYSWMLVQESDILVHQRLADDHAPSGLRDVLWVRGNANVVQGSGAQSTAGRFLVGEFTRAGDFAASTSGGTFSAATGLLCEATTPGCCMKPRTR